MDGSSLDAGWSATAAEPAAPAAGQALAEEPGAGEPGRGAVGSCWRGGRRRAGMRAYSCRSATIGS
ncbi:MAG TPA: hypothetical protein VE075_03920, partial [Thermoanaerobaculia bacterium]|nr:hypothetical protein [Thermoanaerobaculia bacterium]